MLTPLETLPSLPGFPFIINTLRGLSSRRSRQIAQTLVAAALLAAMAACGAASSNNNPPPPAGPKISSFVPTSGVAGTVVVITGTNLNGATAVTFNGKAAASFSVDSATQITTTVASGTTTGKIIVATPNGTAGSTTTFTILNSPAISSFNPTSGTAGTSVTITGTNFTGATAVAFSGKPAASFTVNSATQITAVVASGTSTGKISVATPNGNAMSAGNFTINVPPTISAFNPTTGPVGTAVVIAGANFTGATVVAFNGKAASGFTVNSSTQITATVASATTTGKITVTTPGGAATSASNFTVTSGGATLDLSIDGLYITQATQDYPNPIVPLVQNRSAWVRVFVRANQANTATPQVKVDFSKGGTALGTVTVNAGGTSVPLSIDIENASASWNTAVSAAWIQPGTQVVATVDPTNAIAEADETNNTFSQNLDVRNLKTWKVTLIPVQTGVNTGVVENGSRTRNDWMDFAKRIHPVPDAIDVTVGSVMTSSVTTLQSDGTGWDTVLSELQTKRTLDGVTDRYYYGAVHTTYNSGVAGLGFIGAPEAIGWDVTGSFPSVLAHEVGHNFGRKHSPCGNPAGVDPNYPYPGAIIGVPGWDVFAASNNLKPSSTYVDMMSYCSPVWVSDYTYMGVLAFRAASGIGIIVPGPGGAAVASDGLLVWGRIENGEVTLEPAFRILAKSSVADPGPYTWEARDAIGRVLTSVNFGATEVADLPDRSVQMFSLIVPLQSEILGAMQTMHVKIGNQELARRTVSSASAADFEGAVRMQDLPKGGLQIVWDADRFPVLMLRDARTGEVRGFLRGGNVQIEGAPDEIEVHAPDATRGEAMRHRRIPE